MKLWLRNIKKGFATNSSSYHSTLIMTDEEYKKWTRGEITVDGYSEEEWYDTHMETEDQTYTTPGGEKIHILSKFGYDG